MKGFNHFRITSFLKLILGILLLFLIVIVIVLSSVPPVSKDALTHHLAVPKLYLKNGGIYEIPHILFSYYPMNLDLLYLIPLYFNNDIIPKYIHFSFALCTALMIFYYLRKRIDNLFALLGMLFFLSLPIIIKLSITAYVDLGLIFFSTASLVYLFKWIENQFKIKYLLLSGVCCGLCLGTKYNGLIVLFLLALFIPFIFSRKTAVHVGGKIPLSSQTKALGYGTVFILSTLVIFSPWMIKNYAWTKNPLYPLYDNLFNPVQADQGKDLKKFLKFAPAAVQSQVHLNHFSLRRILYGETGTQIALIPLRIFFEGKDGMPQYFDGKLNPLLFFLPFFAFIGLKNNPPYLRTEKRVLLAFVILFILFVFFHEDMRIRWIAPVIPPLVLLSMFGLHDLLSTIKERFSTTMGIVCAVFVSLLVLLLLGSNVQYIQNQFKYVDPISYLTGRVDRDKYISNLIHEYPTIRFANKNLPQDARILCLFIGDRRYYSDREMVFNEGLFRTIIKRVDSPKLIIGDFAREGITHFLVRYDLFNDWVINNFNDREKEVVEKFFDEHVAILFSKSNYGLFKLKLP